MSNTPNPYRHPNSNIQPVDRKNTTTCPSFVKLGTQLIIVTSVLGLLALFFTFDLTLQLMANGGTVIDEAKIPTFKATIIASGLLALALNVLFCKFILKGKNWARIVMLILLLFGLIVGLPEISKVFSVSIVWGLWTCLMNIISILGIVCLYMPISNLWFNAMRHQ